MKVFGRGPEGARILICGEAPGASEELAGEPFVGASGQELNRMLQEAGIMRSECYMTNVSLIRPQNNDIAHFIAGMKYKQGGKTSPRTDRHVKLRDKWVTPEIIEGFASLQAEVARVKPNLVVAMGNVALWAFTEQWAITKWRGSQLVSDSTFGHQVNVIPTIHPAAILQQWELRGPVVNDLRRAARHMQHREYQNIPKWNFILRPSFDVVKNTLMRLLFEANLRELWIDFDIETKQGHIDCISVSWSRTDAICIPLMTRENKAGYWSADEEASIVFWLFALLSHYHCRVRWQNGLYDSQYVHKWWHFLPKNGQDTMISQHSAFCAMPKGLGFLGSMYADYYVYWKDEGKIASNEPEDKRWRYNCLDCVYTREVGEVLEGVIDKLKITEVEQTQQRLFSPVLSAMLRGVAVSTERRAKLAMEIQDELSSREAFLYNCLGHSINVASAQQMQILFYEDLKQPVQYNRTPQGNRPSCDDEALAKIAAREPLLRPVCNAISDIRTLSKWLKDFVLMSLDSDGRMRCSFNIAGDAAGKSAPYSYRLSSSKNAFDSGGNLQTIPSEKSKSAGKAAQRGSMVDFKLPNLRSMYVPDQGYTFFDLDLDRADLQVVVAEADDAMLKSAMRMGADIHLLNTYSIDGIEAPPLEELVEGHPRYNGHRAPRKYKREFAKVFCHATNYLGGAKTVAAHTGRLVHEIDRAQKAWFGAHPGIKAWHQRTESQVKKFHFVENRFGYRWYIFDRLDNILSDAVAWIPQSTVGAVINRIWLNFHDNLPEVQTLLQVHDSVAGQVPSHKVAELLPKMKELSKIIIPYPEPLIIPTGIKTSTVSWGDCA